VNAIDPARIYIGGEITAAWDLVEGTVLSSLKERTLRPVGRHVEIVAVPASDYPRLKGAAALVPPLRLQHPSLPREMRMTRS